MTQSINSTRKQIADLQALVISGVEVFQKTDGPAVLQDLKDIKAKAEEIFSDQRGEWPNPKDLDESQNRELGKLCFRMLTEIVKKFKTLPV